MPGSASEELAVSCCSARVREHFMPHTTAIAISRDDNSFERLSYACEESSRRQKNNQLAQASLLIMKRLGWHISCPKHRWITCAMPNGRGEI